jgi:hypothetical protein
MTAALSVFPGLIICFSLSPPSTDAPTDQAGRIAFDHVPLFGNFVTDDATNDSATHCSGSTAAG